MKGVVFLKKKTVRFLSLLVAVIMTVLMLPYGSAFAADWTAQIPSKENSGADFRLGVISDSHLGATQTATNNLDIALNAFSSLGDVDALAMNGDMVYAPATSNVTSGKYVYNDAEVSLPAALYSRFKSIVAENGEFTFAGTQNGDVFTADTTSGKPIIYSMGNHEFPENDRNETLAAASKQLYTEQTGRNPNHIMNVGGYTFIMSSAKDFFNDFKAAEEFVKAQILAAESADPSNKPIFYLQHEGVHGTVVGSDSTADGNTDSFKDFLNEHPRVVVLSAHTHAAEEDPRTIWQDGFTAVSTGKTGGGSVSGHGGKYSMGNNTIGSQCLLFDIKENTDSTDLKIYRLNLLTGLLIGEPWSVTIDGTKDNFKYTKARYDNPSIAKYNDDASLTILNEARQGFKFTYYVDDVEITKSEDYLQDDFVHSYRVVVKNTDANVVTQNFKVFADIFVADENKVSSYTVTLPNQLDRATNYEISVYPLTPFTATSTIDTLEAKGVTPVTYSFKTSETLTDADRALIRTHENVNVSKGKKVYAGNPNRTNAQNMVDGVFKQYIAPATNPASGTKIELPDGKQVDATSSNADDWFIVDLGRRYDISEVKVWPRGDSSQNVVYMQNFIVEAANEISAEKWDKIGSVGTKDAPSDFTAVSFKGNGNSYRYVRLRKTGITYHIYSEIEVFADVKTQEVSRNRQAEVNFATYSNMGASYTVDGTLTNSSKCWLIESLKSTDPEPPYNLVIDLEQDYPIGFIEMFGRYGVNASTYRNNWKIYGFTDAQGKPDANISDFSEAALLYSVTQAYPQITNGTNPEGLKASIDGDGKYRYIVFSKTKKELAAVGEVRAEIVIPEMNGAERIDANTLKISFSDKMDADTITADMISVTTDAGTVIEPSAVSLTDATSWDGGYDATLTFEDTLPQTGIKVAVSGNSKSAQGAALTDSSEIRISGKAIEINKTYAEKIENVNVALNKPVYSGRVDAEGYKLTNGEFKEMLHLSQDGYPETAPDILLPSGDTLKGATSYGDDWYIVDLGRRYNVKNVKLYPVGSNYGYIERWMQNVAIDASNSITFDDYVTLDALGSDIVSKGVTDNSTPFSIDLDGTEAYRYIRVRRTVRNDYAYGELEVYADLTATEVSRNAGVTIDEGYTNAFGTAATSQVTNGNKSYEYGGVLFEGVIGQIAPPYNVLVDLGAEYPIGFVQMWSRGDENGGFTGVEAYRRNWKIYGAAEANAPQNAQDTSKSDELLTVGAKEYPMSGLKGMIDGGTYRYLTLSKTAQEIGCVGEFKASVLNPEVLGYTLNEDGTITVNFTDKMELSTLTEDYISIEGAELSNPVVKTGWDEGYSVTFNVSGTIKNGAELTVNEKVRNELGIEMAENAVILVDTGVVFVKEDGTVNANVIAKADGDAVLYVAVKNSDNRLVNVYMSEKVTLEAGKAATFTVTNVSKADGETMTAYLFTDGTIVPLEESCVLE